MRNVYIDPILNVSLSVLLVELSSDNDPSSKFVLRGSWLYGFNNAISGMLSLSELSAMLETSENSSLLSF